MLKACGWTGDRGYKEYLKQFREATDQTHGTGAGGNNSDDSDSEYSDSEDDDDRDDNMGGGGGTFLFLFCFCLPFLGSHVALLHLHRAQRGRTA